MEQRTEELAQAEARRVLRALLLGVDPVVHSRLSPECVVMQPEVKVALALGMEALQTVRWMRRVRPKPTKVTVPSAEIDHAGTQSTKKLPMRAGDSWTKREDDEVTRAFYAGKSLSSIAKQQARSSGAIAARLVRMGLVRNRQEARRTGYFAQRPRGNPATGPKVPQSLLLIGTFYATPVIPPVTP